MPQNDTKKEAQEKHNARYNMQNSSKCNFKYNTSMLTLNLDLVA